MELFRSSSRKRRLEIFPFFFLLNTTAVFPPQIHGLTRGQGLFEFRFFVVSTSFFLVPRTIYFQLYPYSRITTYNWEEKDVF